MLSTIAGVIVFGPRLAMSRIERIGVPVADFSSALSVLNETMVKPFLIAMSVWTVLLALLAMRRTKGADDA